MQLRNLKNLFIELKQKYQNTFVDRDMVLPDLFKESVKVIGTDTPVGGIKSVHI
jgi:hypothetical protein